MAAEIWEVDLEESGLLLNADGTDYVNAEYPSFKVMEIGGTSVLYCEESLALRDIPQGMHLYRIQKNLPGDRFYSMDAVAPGGNIGGCVISKTPLDLGSNGVVKFTEDTQPMLTEEEQSFGEYLNHSQENCEVINLG